MIAVIFEVCPAEGQWDEYLNIAVDLKSELEKIAGFISVERFRSMTGSGKILSLSFWKDEESVALWRNTAMHRTAQKKGRESVFDNYRLRVAAVQRDYGMHEREQAPDDSRIVHKKSSIQ